nr:immunoglobulin light chain junction region [Macaca mulatta]
DYYCMIWHKNAWVF